MAKGKPGPGKKYSPWLGFRPGLKRRDDMERCGDCGDVLDDSVDDMVDLRCDKCGHWIAYDDLANQSARRALVTPDAEGTREEWETLCPLCKRAQEVGGI